MELTSPRGFDTRMLPWRLWEKAKANAWDPADIDFSGERAGWDGLTQRERDYAVFLAGRFMIGEEAVTIEILPLLRAVANEGRLEETMFLTSFAHEEAKHIEFFRRWFDAIGVGELTRDEIGPARGILHDILPAVMRKLETDPSPRTMLDAAITYNQVVEGVLALVGYHIWSQIFGERGILPGLRAGLDLVQRDERRHIAYGTYLCRRLIAADPALWDFARDRIGWFRELIATGTGLTFEEPYPFGVEPDTFTKQSLIHFDRRLEVIEVARGQTVAQVELGTAEEELEDALNS